VRAYGYSARLGADSLHMFLIQCCQFCTGLIQSCLFCCAVTGFVKARGYSARLGADSLQVVPISQAQARQRSGRAGREAPGQAYRLYTEASFNSLSATTPPEITRVNLGSVVLQLKVGVWWWWWGGGWRVVSGAVPAVGPTQSLCVTHT
jgi:hypothetical protein